MKKFEWLLFTTILCSAYQHVLPFDSNHRLQQDRSRRVKRIINGSPLTEHDYYRTQFMIDIRFTYGCTSDQSKHIMDECRSSHVCAGSLITADFVLSACHCMVYEQYYLVPSNAVPDIKNVTPQVDYDYLPGMYLFIQPESYHPILNAMTLWAGSPVVWKMKDARHAMSFFPHSLCMARQKKAFPSLWKKSSYSYDVGLIMACEGFQITKGVQLAQMLHGYMLIDQLNAMTRKSAVCLFVGWGWYDGTQQSAETLLHEFSYIQCHKDCDLERTCTICSHHLGPQITYPAKGDSGGPVICENYVVGVISWGYQELQKNYTVNKAFPVACVKGYLSSAHLAYLRSTSEETFHWISGVTIPWRTPRTTTERPRPFTRP